MTAFHRICVPTDLSRYSERALAYAARLAHEEHAQIHLLHVLPSSSDIAAAHSHPDLRAKSPAVHQFLQTLAGEEPAAPPPDALEGIEVIRAQRIGDPAEAICDYAQAMHVDLIVMGTHSRTGFSRIFLGSVAEAVVRGASCPVLVVPLAAAIPEQSPALAEVVEE